MKRSTYDPSSAATYGPYAGTLNAYVRDELNFSSDLPYQVLAHLYETWDYSKHQNKYVDMSETLRAAMTQNPYLKVIIANGYFDLATPFSATEYTVNHLGLEPHLRGNVQMTYYAGRPHDVRARSVPAPAGRRPAPVRAAVRPSLTIRAWLAILSLRLHAAWYGEPRTDQYRSAQPRSSQ